MEYKNLPKDVTISLDLPMSLMVKFERLAYNNDKRPEDALRFLIEESVAHEDLSKMQKDVEEMCRDCEIRKDAEANDEQETVVRGFQVEKPCQENCGCEEGRKNSMHYAKRVKNKVSNFRRG